MITKLVVGKFYTASDGCLIKTYGHGPEGVSWYTYKDQHGITKDEIAMEYWTDSDLTDFPEHNAANPRLPYVFDTNWDIKRVSELFKLPSDDYEDAIKLLRLMVASNQFTYATPLPRSPLARLDKLLNKKVKIKVPKCKTPGCVYGFLMHRKYIKLTIDLPHDPKLTADQATQLDQELHDALESVLAKFFI